MTRSEYETRRRAFEEQVRADIALIQAAHETRIHALERLWQAANEANALQTVPIQAADRPSGVEMTRPAVPVPPAPEPKPASPRGQVLADLCDILPELPEVFERPDLRHPLKGSRACPHYSMWRVLTAFWPHKPRSAVRTALPTAKANNKRAAPGF